MHKWGQGKRKTVRVCVCVCVRVSFKKLTLSERFHQQFILYLISEFITVNEENNFCHFYLIEILFFN